MDERVASGPGMNGLPACPLMHGTGCMTQLDVLAQGGKVVTLTSHGRWTWKSCSMRSSATR